MPEVLVATVEGLRAPGGDPLDGCPTRALQAGAERWWAVADDRRVVHGSVGGPADELGTAPKGTDLWCLAPLPDQAGALAGSSEARLWQVHGGEAEPVASFDEIEGRDGWYTPWGDPPDTRSLTVASDGTVFVNVHVGGLWRAPGLDGPWQQVIEVDADVHQVVVDDRDGRLAVAAAAGLAESTDGGATWTWTTSGLHGSYCRAVAITEGHLLVTASTGPRTDQAAVYRRPLGSQEPFRRCHQGLPDWFHANIDTFRLAASGDTVALGTPDGEVWVSVDGAATWEPHAKGLPAVTAVAVAG